MTALPTLSGTPAQIIAAEAIRCQVMAEHPNNMQQILAIRHATTLIKLRRRWGVR